MPCAHTTNSFTAVLASVMMSSPEPRLHAHAPASACSCPSSLSMRKRITGCPVRVRLRSSAPCARRRASASATRARCSAAARTAASRSAAAAAWQGRKSHSGQPILVRVRPMHAIALGQTGKPRARLYPSGFHKRHNIRLVPTCPILALIRQADPGCLATGARQADVQLRWQGTCWMT